MSRPTWEESWLAVAKVIGRRSICVRSQVGAVIVDDRNRIVATGYNGPPAGYHVPIAQTEEGPWESLPCDHWCPRGLAGPTPATARSYTDCPSLHAEANALSVCDRSLREGGTIYVTSPICYGCAKLIANSGLKRVVMLLQLGDFHHRDPDQSLALLDHAKIIHQTFEDK